MHRLHRETRQTKTNCIKTIGTDLWGSSGWFPFFPSSGARYRRANPPNCDPSTRGLALHQHRVHWLHRRMRWSLHIALMWVCRMPGIMRAAIRTVKVLVRTYRCEIIAYRAFRSKVNAFSRFPVKGCFRSD